MIALIRKIYTRTIIVVDLLLWWYRAKAIRSKPTPTATRTVLVCGLMTMLGTAKVEALMVSALSKRGYHAVVLLSSRSRIIEWIYLACGQVEFIYLDKLLDSQVKTASEARVDQLLQSGLDISELANLEIDGFRTGRNVLSRVLRRFRVGRIDPTSADHIEELRSILMESFAVADISRNLLQHLQPCLAIFLEKGYTPAGEVYDACLLQGIDTIQWLSAPQADRLLFKRYSISTRADHPFALGADTWKQLKSARWSKAREQMVIEQIASHYKSGAWYNRQQLQTGKKLISPGEVRSLLGVRKDRKVAVIFAHILYDATFFYGDSLYQDYEQWLVETVRAAIGNPHLDWIIKVHPVNVWRSRMDGVPMEQIEARIIKREFGKLPPHISLMSADTDINTYALYQILDYGLTVRGTVGMELPCLGVPVVTAGTGRYSGHGFTIDPVSREDYLKIIATLHEVPRLDENKIRLARQYAFGALFLRQYPMRVFQLNYKEGNFGVNALWPVVQIDRKLAANWPESSDISTFLEWATASHNTDLLANISLEFDSNIAYASGK